ncbi:MAG: metallophosphoesterase family protein [Pseudomonadota bacterium]
MTVLMQISDPHFGTEQPPVVEALVTLTHAQRPDLLVLSGDITQRARPSQFRAARAFMDRLGGPVLAIPGNHDLPLFDVAARLWRPYASYRKAFGEELEPVHESSEALVVGVNTTRTYRHKNGQVGRAQIERVAQRLRAATPGQLRVVVVHQPVVVTHAEDWPDRLRNRTAALSCWAKAGADLVLGGHIHLPFVMPLKGLARPVWAVQAGTAVSSRVRRGVPNSVNLLRWCEPGVEPGTCVVEQWDFSPATRAFVRGPVTPVQPARVQA